MVGRDSYMYLSLQEQLRAGNLDRQDVLSRYLFVASYVIQVFGFWINKELSFPKTWLIMGL